MTSYRERVILKALWGIPTELKRGIEMEEKKNLWSSYDEAAKKELHEINEKYNYNKCNFIQIFIFICIINNYKSDYS